MFATHHIQPRPSILLIALGIVILAVISLKSVDIPVRQDVIHVPVATPVIEEWRGNSGSIPAAPVHPPAPQTVQSQ